MEVLRNTLAISGAVMWLGLPTLILFCVVAYRIFLHPLAKIPGPLFQRLSALPRILQCRKGDRHLQEAAAHERYGPVLRIAPSAVTFNTLSALQTIHAKDSNVFKGDEFYGLLDGRPDGGRSIMMTEKASDHAARRRVLDKALPPRDQAFRKLKALARTFASTAFEEACHHDGSADIAEIATWYSFDLISSIAFGKSFDMLNSDEYRWAPGCLKVASVFFYWGGYSPWLLPFYWWFLGTRLPALLRLRTIVQAQNYAQLADTTFDARAARIDIEKGSPTRADIFKHLISTKLYSNLDLRADSSLLIAAGSDAIRLTIASTLFYWLKNPSTFSIAQAEIRSSPAPSELTDAQLSFLKYLRASVDEAMRLSPPKAASLPREVLAGGIVVDDIYIPQGATVGVSVYALHHDASIYPDPYAFKPERWLSPERDPRMQAAFCPFLKGPRACPGKTVAYFGVELALYHLVWEYDVRFKEGEKQWTDYCGLRWREDEYQFNDWILGYADGPVLELKQRS